MPFRTILALAAAAALSVPAAALAEGPGPTAPSCAPGQSPTAAAPCRLPLCGTNGSPRGEGQGPACAVRICGADQTSTPDAPCLSPCAPGVRPSPDAPCAPVPGTEPPHGGGDRPKPAPPTPNGAGAGDAPKGGFGLGFIKSRIWRVTGEADGFDADRHALSIVVENVTGIAPRLAARLEEAL